MSTLFHYVFLPVAEALIDRLFFAPAPVGTLENTDLLRQAEAWASGEEWEAPAAPTPAPYVFVGGPDGPDIGPDSSPDSEPDPGPDPVPDFGADSAPDLGADVEGEPWTDYHELNEDGWEALKPFLPETMAEDRGLISGLLWVYTTRPIYLSDQVPDNEVLSLFIQDRRLVKDLERIRAEGKPKSV